MAARDVGRMEARPFAEEKAVHMMSVSAGPIAQMVGTVGLLAAAHMVAFWNDRYRTFAERSMG